MHERQHNLAAYRQPAFLTCAVVLALAGVGMSLATRQLGPYLQKEPLPLRRPLDALEEGRLTPYRVLAKIPIEDVDILESLGTRDYIQWVLEDPREPTDSPVRKVLLFLTYYQQADRVPHVPEECYTGGGYRRLATDAVVFHLAAADDPREVPGRYLLFDKASPAVSGGVVRFPVVYLFRVNGAYAGNRDEARLALNRSLFHKHAYFSKIELAFNQSVAAPTQERATAAGAKLLDVLLPLLEREHWPDGEG